MFHSGFGYGFGCFDDRIDRSGFAEKSAAAQRREDAAKEAFNKIRAETEASATNTVVVQLLKLERRSRAVPHYLRLQTQILFQQLRAQLQMNTVRAGARAGRTLR